MKKILLLIPTLDTGGAEKFVIDLCKFLNHELFDTKIVCLYPRKNNIYTTYVESNNMTVAYLNKKKGFSLSFIIKITKYLIKEKPDIIHTNLYSAVYSLFALIILRRTIKIHTIHNEATKELPKTRRLVMKLLYSFFNVRPVAISPRIKKSIMHTYRMSDKKVYQINNGIDIEKFPSRVRKINHLNEIKFIHVGRFSPQKNHKLLIEAFRMANKTCSNISLTLVGDGELTNEIKNLVNEYGLTSKVRFYGVTSEVATVLLESDVFILSSDWEGLPLSVIEAMSTGLPIISTDVGGISDLVYNDVNGYLVRKGNIEDLSNAIVSLCKDKDKLLIMSYKSSEIAKEFDIKKMVEKYSEVYLMKR